MRRSRRFSRGSRRTVPLPVACGGGAALGRGALQFWRGLHGLQRPRFRSPFSRRQRIRVSPARKVCPLGLGLASATVVVFAFYVSYHVALVPTGLAGLAVAAVWNVIAIPRASSCCRPAELEFVLGWAHCGRQRQERMPADACLYFCESQNPHAMLRPKPCDSCVVSTYGPVKCSRIQSRVGCCATGYHLVLA